MTRTFARWALVITLAVSFPAAAQKAPLRNAPARPADKPETRKQPPKKTGHWFRWTYLIDWGLAAAIGLGGTLGVYHGMDPAKRPFDVDDRNIGLPLKKNSVPGWALSFAAVIPLAAVGTAQAWSKSWHDVHHGALGLAEALGLTVFFTVLLKRSVGRLRPDFLARCRPDPSGACTGPKDLVREGREAFPSGHTSIAFAGGTFTALYLWGKLKPFRHRGALWRIVLILSPIAAATVVGATRITDNRHHATDVLGGALLGIGFAYLGYRLNFPNPWTKTGGKPLGRGRVAVLPMATNGGYGLSFHGVFP